MHQDDHLHAGTGANIVEYPGEQPFVLKGITVLLQDARQSGERQIADIRLGKDREELLRVGKSKD